jgi:hypothetical protein
MPFDFAIPRTAVPMVADADHGASMRAIGCASPGEAFATEEEVRRAHQLRLQLREHFLRRPVPPCLPWSVGAD